MLIKPQPLKSGDTIATVATSNWIPDKAIESVRPMIEGAGFSFYVHPQTAKRDHQQAGSAKERAGALCDTFADPKIKAIILTAGGDRALHILDYLDYDLIRQNPKIIVGYSDATAVLSALHSRTGLVCLHGGDISKYSKSPPPHVWNSFRSISTGDLYSYPMEKTKILREGAATGVLYGGNLCLLSNLWGTKYAPDLSGKILFFEDEKESLWNIDRMLLYARRVGRLDDCAGILIGGFSECSDKTNAAGVGFGHTLEDLVLEHTEGLDIPVVSKAPFGHLDLLHTIPIGGTASLTARNDRTTLLLTEPAMAV
ncbi:MAG: S66 peptidase family protein [Pseudomonadota bacterium]